MQSKNFQLDPANANEDVRRLYETAFPKEEQIPWADLMRLMKTMSLDLQGFRSGSMNTFLSVG